MFLKFKKLHFTSQFEQQIYRQQTKKHNDVIPHLKYNPEVIHIKCRNAIQFIHFISFTNCNSLSEKTKHKK